ncbi:MAG: cytochrome c biogenesis CcdA family protein [Rhizobiaceae bacterium]|nr:cytochrome c biogenesis CcdA family protein [Rhizobiaceae bacterium]
MDLVFGYIAGLLTLLNPCVLPVLPVILITALNTHRLGPLYLCAGLCLTFVTVGMFVASLGPALGISDTLVSRVASVVMIGFGLILIVPALSQRFTLAASTASGTLSNKTAALNSDGLGAQFLTGVLLGAVWSPCIGPTLGGAIALASSGNDLGWAALIMLSFAFGVSTIILVLATLSRDALLRNRERMMRMSQWARPIMGGLLVAVGAFLFFGLHYTVERWAVENLPYWFQDLSITF